MSLSLASYPANATFPVNPFFVWQYEPFWGRWTLPVTMKPQYKKDNYRVQMHQRRTTEKRGPETVGKKGSK